MTNDVPCTHVELFASCFCNGNGVKGSAYRGTFVIISDQLGIPRRLRGAARSLGQTRRPRPLEVRCPRAISCPSPTLCPRVGHKAKRRMRVWCSLSMLGPRAQRQRYASVLCLCLPTDIHSLFANQHSSSFPTSLSLARSAQAQARKKTLLHQSEENVLHRCETCLQSRCIAFTTTQRTLAHPSGNI